MSKENLLKSVFESIRNKNLAKLKEIFEPLSSKVKREVLNGKSNSMILLEYAVQPHFLSDEIVEYLIEQGADPNKMLDNQCFLLHIAILKGYLTSAKALINNGADINMKNQGFEALENMKLSNGLNGRTALHFAIQLYNEYKVKVEVYHESKAEFYKKVETGYLSKIDGDYQAKLNEIEEIEINERKTFKIRWGEVEKEADRKKRIELRKALNTIQKNMIQPLWIKIQRLRESIEC